MNTGGRDIVNETFPDAQAQIRRRLDEIWATARSRDFERLESFHLYGPKFTEFKDGKARGDARSCAAGERMTFTMIAEPSVDMRDLAVNVFGDVAIATGDDWKIVHEHFSPLGGPMPPRH